MDINELRLQIEGDVVAIADQDYEEVRNKLVWNELKPQRRPALIVRVPSERDVVAAVRFAREHGLGVAVRGGGHSWVGFALRDNSLLIDLGSLNDIRLNADRSLVVQPAATGREVNARLAPHGLGFPVGHCPTVPLSGFLLNGGLGWNSGGWGPACFSIRSANVVTANGEIVVVDDHRYSDLLWAIRGGGPGFFGVVTQYELQTYPLPKAITTSTFFYHLDHIAAVGTRAAIAAAAMSRQTELTMFVAPAPPEFAEQCRSSNGYIVIVSAVAFVDSSAEAAALLGELERALPADGCLGKQINESATLDGLLDLGGSLWPDHHRYLADTLWSNTPPAQSLDVLRARFLHAPSRRSVAACVIRTRSATNAPALPDAAFSMTAQSLLLCYAVWERAEDDATNAAWHREAIAALDRFAVGHYVGESDIVASPSRAERSYAPANWARLKALRQTYDPGGLFLNQFR